MDPTALTPDELVGRDAALDQDPARARRPPAQGADAVREEHDVPRRRHRHPRPRPRPVRRDRGDRAAVRRQARRADHGPARSRARRELGPGHGGHQGGLRPRRSTPSASPTASSRPGGPRCARSSKGASAGGARTRPDAGGAGSRDRRRARRSRLPHSGSDDGQPTAGAAGPTTPTGCGARATGTAGRRNATFRPAPIFAAGPVHVLNGDIIASAARLPRRLHRHRTGLRRRGAHHRERARDLARHHVHDRRLPASDADRRSGGAPGPGHRRRRAGHDRRVHALVRGQGAGRATVRSVHVPDSWRHGASSGR